MADEIHENDIGTIFQLEVQEDGVAVDISAAISIAMYLRPPSLITKTVVGVFVTDGTDGLIKYTTIANDLNEVGPWDIQGKVELPAWHGYTSSVAFIVNPNIV